MIAEGTADELKARVGGERLEVTVTEAGDLDAAVEVLERYTRGDGTARLDADRRHSSVTAEGGARLLAAVVRDLDAAGVQLDDLGLRRPTLDDVFLTLTGRAAEQAEGPAGGGRTGGRREEVA